jgi:hypothetical protein
MRKILSIPLIFFILFTGIKVKIATHYCRGSVFATRVSLTGEPASCGMEHNENHHSLQLAISNHCCNDVMSSFSFINTYLGSDYHQERPFFTLNNFSFIPFKAQFLECHITPFNNTNSKPPGNDLYSPVLQSLCVFRI